MNNHPKPLMRTLDGISKNHLTDEFFSIAFSIEESLIAAGAQPQKDYTYIDLYKLAQPFVLEMFKTNDKFEYTYPAGKIS